MGKLDVIPSKHIWAKVSHVVMDSIRPNVTTVSFQKVFLCRNGQYMS